MASYQTPKARADSRRSVTAHAPGSGSSGQVCKRPSEDKRWHRAANTDRLNLIQTLHRPRSLECKKRS